MLDRFSRLNERISNNPINKVIVVLLRIIVGGTFIFSGFVKCVDPMGSVYKFHEYIAVLGLNNLLGSEVVLAFAIPILELMLGVMINRVWRKVLALFRRKMQQPKSKMRRSELVLRWRLCFGYRPFEDRVHCFCR